MIFHKNSLIALMTVIVLLSLNLSSAFSKDQHGPHSLSIGGRYHEEQSVFTDLPYGNGDLSYALAYQYTKGIAIWQFACDLGPDVSGQREMISGTTTNMIGVDYIITPQFNVIIIDRFFRCGGGMRTSYIRDVEDDGEWLDLYWQLQLRLSFPIYKRVSIDAGVYYVYERWGKLLEFRFDDLEYGAWLNYAF